MCRVSDVRSAMKRCLDEADGSTATATALALLLPRAATTVPGDGDRIRVALGDIESVETLALFVALERVREEGDRGRAHRAGRRGPRQPGGGRWPGGRRAGRAVRPHRGLRRATADLLPAHRGAVLPGGRPGDVPRLAVPGRRDVHGALAWLDHGGLGQHRRGGGGDRVRRDQLRLRRRGARHRAAAWQRQGHGARHPQHQLRDGAVSRHLPRPRDSRDRRERRGHVRQLRLAGGQPGQRAGPAGATPHGVAGDRRGPAVRDRGAGAARAP